MAEAVRVLFEQGDDLARAIDQAGWMDGEVRTAAIFRQGHSPSMLSSVIGIGLLGLLRRPAGDLPRLFVLAATDSRAAVFKARGVSHGEGSGADYYVTIWPEEVARWPREQVRVERAKNGIQMNATITAAGTDIPVTSHADETVEALLAEFGAPPAGA